MATIKIHDRADQLRVEIVGKFAGETVREVLSVWTNALLESVPRHFTVDISRLSGYDAEGRKLLRDMCQRGTLIAAKTPLSLVFLSEISSSPQRRLAVVSESRIAVKPHAKAITELKHFRAVAGGQ
ncbi:MAG: hypothetical protein ACRD4O_16925 [Bryobacteraceae bacterium]